MEKINSQKIQNYKAMIVSYFMDNIERETVQLQSAVVKKFNKLHHPHYQFKGDMEHGMWMDYVWALNGVPNNNFTGVQQTFDSDIIIFLDIDCVPLCDQSLDIMVNAAECGVVIGNAQRTNHIENGKHIFAAPSAVALSRDAYKRMQTPSAAANWQYGGRSDVAEEYTWSCEEKGIPVQLIPPLRFERKPTECDHWELDGVMPVYGQGTIYGWKGIDLFYHNFQIRHAGQQELFRNKCREILEK